MECTLCEEIKHCKQDNAICGMPLCEPCSAIVRGHHRAIGAQNTVNDKALMVRDIATWRLNNKHLKSNVSSKARALAFNRLLP